MSKKGFKAPFTAPVKCNKDYNSPANTFQKSASLDFSQKGAPSNNVSAQQTKVPKRNGIVKKSPAVSLTDAEYDELFNSVINSVMLMTNSQHSSHSNDKEVVNIPEAKKATSKCVAKPVIPNNRNVGKQYSGKTQIMEGCCYHQTQKNKQSGKIAANASNQSHTYNGMKSEKLFKKQEEKLMNEISHFASQHNSQPSFPKEGQVASNCLSISLNDVNKQSTLTRNQPVHHSRSQPEKVNHIYSRASTPTHHHTPCNGHLHSPYHRESHAMTHTSCESRARMPNTSTGCHSYSFGSYDKNEHSPVSCHKSPCTDKNSQKCHSHQSQSQSQPMLSQPPPHFSLKERLEWLQKRRNVGLWVQCGYAHCSKWRFLHDIHDPVEVPEKWYCQMNSDKNYNSCSVPEKGPTAIEEQDLIHNLYTAGSIVWGRLDGYPWWPAMVDDDPDTEQYYWLNGFSDIPTHYNVTFLDDKEVTRAWLTPSALKPFTGKETARPFKKTRVHGVDYTNRIEIAKLMAVEALQLGIDERLKKFSFLLRHKGPFGTLNSKKREKENNDSDASASSDDNYNVKKKRYNATKRRKQTSVTHSSRKLPNKDKKVKPFSTKITKKKAPKKSCSHKPQTILSRHVQNNHNEKPIHVQETDSANDDKNASNMPDSTSEVQEDSLPQCSIERNVMDDDYEINSSQDLFLSQGKNEDPPAGNKTNDNEKEMSIMEEITDINSGLKNSSQNEKSPEIPQNTTPVKEPKSNTNNDQEVTHMGDQSTVPEHKEILPIADAIVPSSQKLMSQPGDAVVPNIEQLSGCNKNNDDDNDDDDEHNRNYHCNNSEDSADFELEE